MSLTAEQITIAVTVFNRRRYVKQAIASALAQTVPVRVIVVEDCGPDPDLEPWIRAEFGSRIDYLRNPQRRGLFGNWNACMDYCRTPWLSILHDDDYLAPEFVARMIELSTHVPDCALYFGQTVTVTQTGEHIRLVPYSPLETPWRRSELTDTLYNPPFPFPGQLFRVSAARALGGFRVSSQFAGDWEMWSNLIAHYGAAHLQGVLAYNRSHRGPEKGGMKIELNGRMRPLVIIQHKRVLHLLRRSGVHASFNRATLQRDWPMSVDDLVRYGAGFTPRILRYNVGLMLRSRPPSLRYALFQALARVFGVPFVKQASRLYQAFSGS